MSVRLRGCSRPERRWKVEVLTSRHIHTSLEPALALLPEVAPDDKEEGEYSEIGSKRGEGSGIGVYTTLQSTLFLLALPPAPPNIYDLTVVFPADQAQKLDFKTSCGFRRRFINPLHSLLMTGGESRFFHRSASHFNSAENNRKVQRNLSGCTSTSPPVNVQLPASNQHMDTHFLDYHVDFQEFNKILLSPVPEKPKKGHPRETESYCGEFRGMWFITTQPTVIIQSYNAHECDFPMTTPMAITCDMLALWVGHHMFQLHLQEYVQVQVWPCDHSRGPDPLRPAPEGHRVKAGDLRSNSRASPDALSCYYGGVDAKNKAQKSPTTQGCLLLEPEIPLMNETAHHNIHVLSKLLAKRSLKIRQYVVLAKAITLQVYV
ncbi:hypothetical protein MJG53_006618 [Ovis ammon polii x Ovis aries]|uniref:Uncharacterized protein n=1 Tax=Ovis ammon polii x Ovis aries TaxID=2918886 RepID=A0ACB9V665_9CETA|nr:hypothetical protein MJG53_006618 [Ovis ammon polii x Ovis aries]